MVTHHVSPKKALGQHFLADANIARQIAGSLTGHGEYSTVLEVGPGTGMLSRHLVAREDFRWYGLDVDSESVRYLQARYPDLKERIIEGDFLGWDISTIAGSEPVAVIGNFPYNISSQILFRVLYNRYQIPEVVGMFQKEVAKRIAAPPGSKTYGILSVLMQAFYEVELLFDVPPHVFVPPPKVNSTVLRFTSRSDMSLDCDEAQFFAVVKTAFNQRRKTLRNSLKGLNVDWTALDPRMQGERPERLTVKEFVEVALQTGKGPAFISA